MAVSFTNVPAGIRVPLFYAELDNSMANSGSNELKALIIGQMLESGKAVAGKPILVTGDSQGKELFGRGSMLARLNSAFRTNNSFGEVWAIPLADPESAAKASGTLTISGDVDASGTIYVYIGADRISVNVAADETASEVAKAVAAAINAKNDLPVSASATDSDDKSVVTVQAKNGGQFGNDIRLAINLNGYAAGEQTPDGLSIVVADMAGGTGIPEMDAVLSAMGDEEYDFIAMPYADGTCLNAFTVAMNDATGRWSPTKQIYGHVYTAKRGDCQSLRDFGSVLNDQHLTVVGFEEATPSLAVEVLGAYVARCLNAIGNDPARPLQTLELFGISGAPEGERFNLSEKQTLLTNGIATTYQAGGYVRIERAVTTYQKNAFGDNDTSYLDSETLHTLAYIIRTLRTTITSKYPRHKLASDGTKYGTGQAIVTPNVIRGELIAQYQKLEMKGIVENSELFKKYLIVERNVDDPNRLDVLLPPDLVNGLRIFAALVQFRLQYEE